MQIQSININQELLNEAIKLTGLANATEAIEYALQKTIKLQRQAEVKKFRGKLTWDGDIETMRADNHNTESES